MTESLPISDDDCQQCGACCAPNTDWLSYPEVTDEEALVLPERFRLQIIDGELATRDRRGGVRCVALEGELGVAVRCEVHDVRPEVCRQFTAGSRHCLEARADVLRELTGGQPPSRP